MRLEEEQEIVPACSVSTQPMRARMAALHFHMIYVCSATATKTRTAAYTPRYRTYYEVRNRHQECDQKRTPLVFDSDSVNLTVDNCASVSVTNDLRDFISPPKASRTRIVGVNTLAYRGRRRTHPRHRPTGYILFARGAVQTVVSPTLESGGQHQQA